MREIILGTAGHVDHGKTSLVRALTGIDTDRLKEEKRRGITIELGFAFLDLPCGRRLGIIDVPGHERFVRNMVAGAAGMDMVAFIIAADEGIMPQSREHLEICRLLGVGQGIVVITKKDSVEADWLDMVIEEVRDFVAGSFLEGSSIVSVSSLTGEGIDTLVSALDRLVQSGDYPDPHGPFRMPVDRIFSMKGFGSVVTGTSISGSIRIGEEIMLYPDQVRARIRGIQVHGSEVETVGAGRRTAINVQGLEKEMIHRGDMAASPGCLEPAYIFDVLFRYLDFNKKSLKHRSRVRVHMGTAEIMGRIALVERDEIQPGEETYAQLLLESPAVAWPGDHFVVRSYSPVTTIGGGIIYNCTTKKRKRALKSDRGKNRETFAIFQKGDQEETVLLLLAEAGATGLDFNQLAVKSGIFGNRLKKILERPVSTKKILIIESDRQRMQAVAVHIQLRDNIRHTLASFHATQPLQPGMPTEELRSNLSGRIDAKLFQHLLQSLIRDGSIDQQGALVHLAGHRVTLKEDEQKLRDRLTTLYCESQATPPTTREAEGKMSPTQPAAVRDMIGVLVREGILVRVSEHLYFSAVFLADLQERMVKIMQTENELSPSRFKEITGASRKFTIPLLEYYDAVKITMRIGEKRVLRKI